MAWIEQLQSGSWGRAAVCAIGSYLIGSVATGYYLVRWRAGRDIRQIGSGSTGARNVGRLLGKTAFTLTALGDLGKGALAVGLAAQFMNGSRLLLLITVLAVVAGHLWPVQLRFHGGKGVATSLGALLVFDYRLALAFGVFFLAGFALWRKVTLPALAAFMILPLAEWWFNHDGVTAMLVAVLSGMTLFAHRKNVAGEIMELAARRNLAPGPEQPEL